MQKGLVDYCVTNSIAILSYFSMERGLLTGSMAPGRIFKNGDTRKTNPLFSPDSIRRINAIVAELRPFADTYRATVAQVGDRADRSPEGNHARAGGRSRRDAGKRERMRWAGALSCPGRTSRP